MKNANLPSIRAARPLLAAAVFAAIAGCASTPKPTAEIETSKSAVASALSAGAAELAPFELQTAQDKADKAARAMANEDYQMARRLAEEAAADAKLAEAKAFAAKADNTLQESQEGMRALREEIGRQTQ